MNQNKYQLAHVNRLKKLYLEENRFLVKDKGIKEEEERFENELFMLDEHKKKYPYYPLD